MFLCFRSFTFCATRSLLLKLCSVFSFEDFCDYFSVVVHLGLLLNLGCCNRHARRLFPCGFRIFFSVTRWLLFQPGCESAFLRRQRSLKQPASLSILTYLLSYTSRDVPSCVNRIPLYYTSLFSFFLFFLVSIFTCIQYCLCSSLGILFCTFILAIFF